MSFLDSALNIAGGAAEAVETLASDLLGLGDEIVAQLRQRGEADIPTHSSAIIGLRYRRDRTLSITFKDGRRYAIPDFPAIELHRWLSSPSLGGYWNAVLKGKYA